MVFLAPKPLGEYQFIPLPNTKSMRHCYRSLITLSAAKQSIYSIFSFHPFTATGYAYAEITSHRTLW